MCGRFVDPNLQSAGLDTSWLKINPIPRRFNVKPTQDVLVAAKEPLEGMMARWGLVPSWHKGRLQDWKATTFNARIEDAREKPTFRNVWRFGRCLIPAAGYFEWVGDKAPKQPHFIYPDGNDGLLWFAGLASRWNGHRAPPAVHARLDQGQDPCPGRAGRSEPGSAGHSSVHGKHRLPAKRRRYAHWGADQAGGRGSAHFH